MAWLSVGSSNEDLCQKMVDNDVLREGPLLDAFRATDRGDFVPEEDRLQSYADRPFKKGKIHISAPHMYVTVLEALELSTGKSFLNIGSGSGYLSCLAAYLLGEEGVSHGVEVSEFACHFSRERAKLWHAKMQQRMTSSGAYPKPPLGLISADGLSFVNANAFDLDVLGAANTMRYDRIYVGAGCPDSRKEFFLSMLADDGILVVPINEKNQMLSIRKFCGRVYAIKPISNVNFAPLIDTEVRPDEQELLEELATQQEGGRALRSDIEASIQRVQTSPSSSSFIIHPLPPPAHSGKGYFSPASLPYSTQRSPSSPSYNRVRLPPLVWAPQRSRHLQFPVEFRRAVMTILLANNRCVPRHCGGRGSCPPNCRCSRGAVGLYLPHQMWLLVFSFASREWFYPHKSELHAVTMELAVERRLRRATEERLRRAEDSRRAVERERDLLRIAMVRLAKRSSGAAAAAGLGGAHTALLLGGAGGGFLGMMDEEDEEDNDEDEHESEEEEDEWEEGEEEGEEDGAEDGEVADGDEEEGAMEEEHGEEGEVHGTAPQVQWEEEEAQAASASPHTADTGPMDTVPSVLAVADLPSPAADASTPASETNDGVWADVEESPAAAAEAQRDEEPYWSAYNSYLQTMHPAVGAVLSGCNVSSYHSAATGTTAESLGSQSYMHLSGGSAGADSSSAERISDFSAAWDQEDGGEGSEEGEDHAATAAFFVVGGTGDDDGF